MSHIVFALSEFATWLEVEFSSRSWTSWLFFFMPLVIFAETPRYVLPAVGLYLLKILHLLPDDEARKRDFLETNPRISALLVGLNEEASIGAAIDSLLELRYPNLEIIVIDDGSRDRMYERAKPYADRGLIKLWKNTAASGRAGRPSVSNLALHLSSGEFILSIDADTSFDRSTILHMIGPFHDPKVGVVGGNIKARNSQASIWARMQAIEYLISIGLWKRWLNLFGMNIAASGAFGAFRREALERVGGWDPELAEDADLSMKIKKTGYKLVFAPDAVAMTNVPTTFKVLSKQRIRWDKGMLRTFYRKHGNIMDVRRFDWRNAFELAMEFFFSVLCTVFYIVYLGYMLYSDPVLLLFVWIACALLYQATALLSASVAISFSERKDTESRLLGSICFFPLYKGLFRWVRFYALLLETFRINYNETYLPMTSWNNTSRW